MTDDIYFEHTETLAESVYNGTLRSIERKPNKDGSGDFLVWTFTADDADGYKVSGTSSLSDHPKSKGMRWARAILGRELKATESLTTLYGRRCLLDVKLKDNGYPRVDEVHPAAPSRAATPAPVVAPPAAGAPEPTDWADVTEESIPF